MKQVTSISFVRHGEVHNPKDIFYGRLPRFPLSEQGLRQAWFAAEVLRDKDIAAIYSSPLLRARQTARIILDQHTNLNLRISRLLIEVHTAYDGRPRSEMEARNWDIYTGNQPQHEQPMDVLTRTRRFIAQVRRHYPGKHVVAVTHGDSIGFMILWVNSFPITVKQKQAYFPLPASVHTFFYHTTALDEVPAYEYICPY